MDLRVKGAINSTRKLSCVNTVTIDAIRAEGQESHRCPIFFFLYDARD